MDLPSVGVSSTGPIVTFGRRRHPETSSPTPPALRSASSTLGSGIAAAIAAAAGVSQRRETRKRPMEEKERSRRGSMGRRRGA